MKDDLKAWDILFTFKDSFRVTYGSYMAYYGFLFSKGNLKAWPPIDLFFCRKGDLKAWNILFTWSHDLVSSCSDIDLSLMAHVPIS